MEPDELAEILKANPDVRIIGGATRLTDTFLVAHTTSCGPAASTDTTTGKRAPIMAPRPSKYRNQRTEYNGRRFHSRKEAAYAKDLDLRVKAGEVLSWIPQVTIPLPGGVRHVIDFLVIWNPIPGTRDNYEVSFVEVKGRDLPMGRMKRKMAQDRYKIKVLVI